MYKMKTEYLDYLGKKILLLRIWYPRPMGAIIIMVLLWLANGYLIIYLPFVILKSFSISYS